MKYPYLKYYWAGLTKYKVHSPFVFEFLTEVFEDERNYHFFGVIENYRRNLLGTGDKILLDNQPITINKIAKSQEINANLGKVLFKTVHKYKPNNLFEIGTSLGISTLYQATPNSKAKVLTLESEETLAKATQQFFKRLGTKNIALLSGSINKNLPEALTKLKKVEQVFFNGFWGKKESLAYFEACLKYASPNTVFVFRSPYQSEESIEFWEAIKQNKQVRLSIDIYHLGFLFLRAE